MKLYLKVLIIAAVLVTVAPFFPQAKAQSTPSREQVMWGTGFGNSPTDFNPYSASPAFGVAFMYEPLFGMNYVTNTPVPDLGLSYAWNTTGRLLTVNLNPAAKWSDNSSVTADDVVFSYNVARDLATNNFATGANAMNNTIDNITAVDAHTVTFGVLANSTFSQLLIVWITTNVNIIPKATWTTILASLTAANQTFVSFQNNWLNSSQVTAAEQVCSGPYVPYSISADGSQEIYVRRDAWWGSGIINPDFPTNIGCNIMSAPKYIGAMHYANNNEQNTAFLNGDVDWFAGYYNQIWNVFSSHPNVYTYYGQAAPYFQDAGSPMTIMVNLGLYPFNLLFLREAMALCINYDNASNLFASGYLSQIPLGYITPNIPTLAAYYIGDSYYTGNTFPNTTIPLAIPSGGAPASAISLLKHYCAQDSNGHWVITAPWAAPAAFGLTNSSPYILGVSPLINLTTNTPVSNAIQTAYGPFNAMCETGWSDVDGETQAACVSITSIGIPVSFRTEAFFNPYVADSQSGNYSMIGYGQGGQQAMGASAVQVLQGFVGAKNAWGSNATGWSDSNAADFATQFATFETASSPAVALTAATNMQVDLINSLPSIPMFCNGYWYAFQNYYWVGWACTVPKAMNFQQPIAQYETSQECMKVRQVLDLVATGVTPTSSATVGGFPAFFLVLAAIAPVAVIIARARKSAI